MFKVVSDQTQGPVIKVIGVGGAGGNAVKHMVGKVKGVDFYAVNTDMQDLRKLDESVTRIQIGANTTQGLGAGTDPEVGRAAAEEDRQRIAEFIHGADMLFIAAGMGGGTGTGAAPVVAEIAKEQNILTVAVVTKPFAMENRTEVAGQGLAELSAHVDTAITVTNDKLLKVLGSNTTLVEAFAAADDVLLGAVQGIADLITCPGVINVDFADVKAVMLGKGHAMMGTGIASGANRAHKATVNAVESQLLEDIAPNSAKGLLVNITANSNLGIDEFQQIASLVQSHYAAQGAKIVLGTAEDESLGDMLKVTVVATGVYGSSHDVPIGSSVQQIATPRPLTVPMQPMQTLAPPAPPSYPVRPANESTPAPSNYAQTGYGATPVPETSYPQAISPLPTATGVPPAPPPPPPQAAPTPPPVATQQPPDAGTPKLKEASPDLSAQEPLDWEMLRNRPPFLRDPNMTPH